MRKVLFDLLVESVKQMKVARAPRAADVLRGDAPDVAALRALFKLSQSKFATLLGISVATLQNWEQGRRQPDGPAKVLLRIAASYPEALLSAMKPATRDRK